nr:hypothetical protein [Tanacetum cinerariifolium]
MSSDDNEMVEVKVLMALAEENDAVSKEGAINGEWVKISMRKVHTLHEMKDNDDRKTYLDYLCIDLNYVKEQRINLLSKHRDLVHELNACKEQLLVLKQAKLDFLTMHEQIPSQKKRILGVDQLTKDPSSSGKKDLVFVKSLANDTKVSIPSVKRPWLFEDEGFILPNHDTATDYDYADESSVCSTPLPPLKKLDALAKDNKSSSASKVNSAPAGKLKSVKIEDDPPLTIEIKELNNLKLQFSKSEALQDKKAEALKSTRAKSLNANRSKTLTKSGCSRHMIGVKSYLHKYVEQPGPKVMFEDDSTCTTKGYGSVKCNGIVFTKSLVSKAFRVFNTRRKQTEETYHITFDEIFDAIKFSKPSVDNINIAKNERYPPDEYLHPYEPSQRYQTNSNDVSFIEPYESAEPVVFKTKVSSNQNGQTYQNDQTAQTNEILNDNLSEHSNHNNDGKIIDNLSNTKDIQISKHSSSLNVEDTLVQDTISIVNPPKPIPSVVTPAPQDRCAFLNGKLKEEVYVKQPPGFKSNEFPNHVCKLDKAFYVLKQAPRVCGKAINETQYRGMIGSLMYLPVSIPNIQFSTCLSARYQANPKESHLIAVKRIFRKNTLSAYQLLGGKLVCWSAKKQQSIATSGCCTNILWMKSQLSNYDIIYEKVPIFCDNTSAIAISNNLILHLRIKHIDIWYHFIRDRILKGYIVLHFIPTQYQLADIFTKPLDEPTFKRLIVELGDANPICTLEDYSKPSHEGYKNTIELPVRNNVCMEYLEQAFFEYASSRTDEAGEKVRKLNSFFESLDLVPQLSGTEFVCTKGDDGDVMFIEIVKKNDDSRKEEPEAGGLDVEYFDTFLTQMLGKPLVYISNMTHDPPKGVVRFTNRTNEITYKMPYKIEEYNSLSDLEKEHTKSVYLRNEEDNRIGAEYVMSKILGFYKECLELEPEYVTGMDEEG